MAEKDAVNSDPLNDSTETSKNDLNCSVCNINVTSNLELRQHLVGQKHKKAYRLLEELDRVNKKCGLYIRGFPNLLKLEQLVSYFETFGSIVWVHMGVGFLLLDYEEPESAEEVLNTDHYLCGRKLYIQRREYKEPRVQKSDYDEEFLNQLKDLGDLSLQLEKFKTELQVDCVENYRNYNKVYEDLLFSLRDNFPYCTINPFGSTVTGLCFKNSDVDVYISGICIGNNSVQYLYSIKDILNRSHIFGNIIVIAHAKIPIVKCVHKETSISCDINLKNMLGVCNSRLIRYYISVNEKIKDMVLILKYWAKVHKITGQNHLFTNYSLCMMVIFFLQQHPYNLPSVLCLQKYDYSYNPDDYWHGGFKEIHIYRSTIETFRKTPLLEMLKGFFNFYSNFEYEKHIICPYLGKALEKEIFKNPNDLPNYYSIYKDYIKREDNLPLKVVSPICLQDPFEHSRNTTSVIFDTVLCKFVDFCKLGLKICENGPNNLLYTLFTEDLQVEQKLAQVTASKFSKSFTITMGTNLKYLQKKIQKSFDDVDRVTAERKAWFSTLVEFMKIVFKDFMNFEVQEVLDNDAIPAKKMKGNDEINVVDREIVHFKCSGKLNIWDLRKNKLKKLRNDEFDKKNFVEKEIAVTESIKTDCGFTPTVTILEFDCFLKYLPEPPSVNVNITKISCYKNTFKSFAIFFASTVCEWFLEYENMLNCELNTT